MVASHDAKLAAVSRAEASLKAEAQQLQAELANTQAARDDALAEQSALQSQVCSLIKGLYDLVKAIALFCATMISKHAFMYHVIHTHLLQLFILGSTNR